MSIEHYQPVEDAFRAGTIDKHDSDTLGKFLMALSNQPLENDRVKHRDVIRGITINHILLKRHIDALDKKNDLTQKLVIVLTIASLVGAGAQVWYAVKADTRAERDATSAAAAQQSLSPATVAPVVGNSQSSAPVKATQPLAASVAK